MSVTSLLMFSISKRGKLAAGSSIILLLLLEYLGLSCGWVVSCSNRILEQLFEIQLSIDALHDTDDSIETWCISLSLSLSLKMPSLFRQVSWVIQIPFLCTVLFKVCVCSLLCSVDACWWVHLLPVLITASLVMETQCVGQKYLILTYTHCQELINSAGNVMLGGQYHTCCCWRFSKMHMTTVSKSSSILFHGLVFSFL